MDLKFWKTYFRHYDSNIETAETLDAFMSDENDDLDLLGE